MNFHFTQALIIMVFLPLISILIDIKKKGFSFDILIKWILFWTIGFRSVTAGIVQIAFPSYTAKLIFELSGDDFYIVIRELGMANLSIGLVAMLSLKKQEWVNPISLIYITFFSLLSINHIYNFQAGMNELISLIFDVGVVVLLTFFLIHKILINTIKKNKKIV